MQKHRQKKKLQKLQAKAAVKVEKPVIIRGRQPGQDEWSGWEPTPAEMKRRARLHPDIYQPWDNWSDDRWESIEEMRLGFRLVCGGSMVSAFEFGRITSNPRPFMSAAEQGIVRRMGAWRDEIHNASMKRYIADIMNAICREQTPGSWATLARAVDFHVSICNKEIAKGWLTRKDDRKEAGK